MALSDKINSINEKYDAKISALNEERNNEIAGAMVEYAAKNMHSRPVCEIISIFEEISPVLVKTHGGKKAINGFKKLMKEDVNLRSSYMLKENVMSGENADPYRLINESLDIASKTVNRSTYKDSKLALAKLVSESMHLVSPIKISEKIDVSDNLKKLYENIETLMWGGTSVRSAGRRIQSLDETVEFMRTSVPSEKNKSDSFETVKEECIKAIEEAWEHAEGGVRIKLTEVKDKLSKKEFSPLTASEDIKYMKELVKTLK